MTNANDRVRTAPSFEPGSRVIVSDYFGDERVGTVQPIPSAGMVRVRMDGSGFDTLADVRFVREVA